MNATILTSIVAVLTLGVGVLTKPTPDDMVIEALERCVPAKERPFVKVGLATMYGELGTKSGLKDLYPLADLLQGLSEGRLVFKSNLLYSQALLDGKRVAFASYGVIKLPTCKQIDMVAKQL